MLPSALLSQTAVIRPCRWVALLLCAASLAACASGDSGGGDSASGVNPKALLGGATTIFDASSQAFSQPAPNLTAAELTLHAEGDAAFEATFVAAGNPIGPGLGPVFNNRSCDLCHGGDGRGTPPALGEQMDQVLMRISTGNDAATGPSAAAGFGTQVQNHAVALSTPEAAVDVAYTEQPGTYPDGAPYTLRAPTYALSSPYTALPGAYQLSPRAPPPVFGRGLLEAIPESTLAALAASQAASGTGVTGKVSYVRNPINGLTEVGRFGQKANVSTLLVQSAGAYLQDMGITSSYLPTEASAGQSQDDGLGDDPEIDQATVDATVFYTQTLAVPARRGLDDATALQGEQLFTQVGCAACHAAPLQTGTLAGVPSVSNQAIYPYADLLLHDMGAGLADGREDFLADGQEWRTPPLWGIGLTQTVSGATFFLHDGRARSLEEAILWHGGEAQAARDAFMALSAAERSALIAFLNSL